MPTESEIEDIINFAIANTGLRKSLGHDVGESKHDFLISSEQSMLLTRNVVMQLHLAGLEIRPREKTSPALMSTMTRQRRP